MSDDDRPRYQMKDFLEEIDTIIWEKTDVLVKATSKGNAPVAGLTRIRIDRLEGIKEYLHRVDRYQREKMAASTVVRPAEKITGTNPQTMIGDELHESPNGAEAFDFDKLKRPTPRVEEKAAEPEKVVHQEPDPVPDKGAPEVEEEYKPNDEW
jgi:hypothetical protein